MIKAIKRFFAFFDNGYQVCYDNGDFAGNCSKGCYEYILQLRLRVTSALAQRDEADDEIEQALALVAKKTDMLDRILEIIMDEEDEE